MIFGLLLTSLATAEPMYSGEIRSAPASISPFLEVPQQSWKTESEDQDMKKQHERKHRNLQLGVLYGVGAISLGVSGYGFIQREDALKAYDAKILELGTINDREVDEAYAKSVPYSIIAFTGLAAGLGSLAGGVVITMQPTNLSVGFQF